MKPFFLSLWTMALFMLTPGLKAQEFRMPAASPHVEINQAFSTSSIKLDYSRPSKRGRQVFGDLIPYGEVWRTGANATTKITFGEDLIFGGKVVKSGTYALYTIPGEKNWQVILNKGVDNWGADGFEADENVIKIEVPSQALEAVQESFSLTFEDLSKNNAVLRLAWDDTKIEVPIEADNDERIMAHLQEQLQGDRPPYMQAAGYYLETNQKLDDALKYINVALEDSPQYYMYWTKARILERLGRHEEALESAKTAAEVAEKEHPAFMYEYQRNYENLKAGKVK